MSQVPICLMLDSPEAEPEAGIQRNKIMEVVLLRENPYEGVEQERKGRKREEALAWPDREL